MPTPPATPIIKAATTLLFFSSSTPQYPPPLYQINHWEESTWAQSGMNAEYNSSDGGETNSVWTEKKKETFFSKTMRLRLHSQFIWFGVSVCVCAGDNHRYAGCLFENTPY